MSPESGHLITCCEKQRLTLRDHIHMKGIVSVVILLQNRLPTLVQYVLVSISLP